MVKSATGAGEWRVVFLQSASVGTLTPQSAVSKFEKKIYFLDYNLGLTSVRILWGVGDIVKTVNIDPCLLTRSVPLYRECTKNALSGNQS